MDGVDLTAALETTEPATSGLHQQPCTGPAVQKSSNMCGHLHVSPDGEVCDISYDAFSPRQTSQTEHPVTDVLEHQNVDFDHTVHERPPVVHEEIHPHIHTVYELRRTRSLHFHEHRFAVQPILDPDPQVLPAEHWAQDYRTGGMFRIPDELGRQLLQNKDAYETATVA